MWDMWDIPWVYYLQKVSCVEHCRKEHIILWTVTKHSYTVEPSWYQPRSILICKPIAFYNMFCPCFHTSAKLPPRQKRLYFSMKAETRLCLLSFQLWTIFGNGWLLHFCKSYNKVVVRGIYSLFLPIELLPHYSSVQSRPALIDGTGPAAVQGYLSLIAFIE